MVELKTAAKVEFDAPDEGVVSSKEFSKPLRRSSRLATSHVKASTQHEPEGPGDSKPYTKKKKDSQPQHFDQDEELTDLPSKPLYKVSSMNFPGVDAANFGLAQEKLSEDPFKVLIACVFLTRTKGTVSMPVCRELFRRYSTPEAIANADINDITAMFQPLGLQNRRARTVISLAAAWHEQPPKQGHRYRKLHYPVHKDGLDISPAEQPIDDDIHDSRTAWEIAHLPGVGAYALDSWRIFCRDRLRGIADGLLDTNSVECVKQERLQEWTRVIPLDKELIAYIRWRWLRLGYLWNPVDGTKIKVDSKIIQDLESRKIQSYKSFDNPWIVYAS